MPETETSSEERNLSDTAVQCDIGFCWFDLERKVMNTNDCMIVTYPNVGEFSHAITIFYLQTVDFASIQ